MSELGVGLSVTQTNITKLVDGLVRSSYVERVIDESDKRKAWAKLTASGVAAFEEIFPAAVSEMGRIWENLRPAEKRQLIHLLAKLKLTLDTGAATEQPQRLAL
jgi:DNA-binding MarR family transcriptional regulator